MPKQDNYKKYIETIYFADERPEETQPSLRFKLVDLCAFWARYKAEYLLLAYIAFNVLSIPAISAEYKRVFSSTKLLLTD